MDVWDELGCALDDTWGTDTENWKEVCLFENMMNVIARVSNRVFVGLPLCRNETYLKAMGNFAQDIMTTTVAIRFVPKLLTPIFGHLFAIPNHIHHRQAAALNLPIIKERLANIARKDKDPNFLWEEPNDYLTWHIRLAQAENRQEELEPERISRRLLPINFAAIHTTVFTITNCFFDLLAPQSVNVSESPVEVIRAEAKSNYISADGTWTKDSLSHLTHSDSALRESMRVSNFLTRGLLRKVVAKDGVENKRSGFKLPHGAYVGVDVHSIQHDPEIYGATAESYDAFRFARAREEEYSSDGSSTGGVDGDQKGGGALESKKLSLSTTSGTFLPFGHGRHAWYVITLCIQRNMLIYHSPGRFLVSHELKMLLAYATMFYEIEPLEARPPNTWFGQHVIPPMKATIRVRRRKAADIGL
jgi:cytochrome P450